MKNNLYKWFVTLVVALIVFSIVVKSDIRFRLTFGIDVAPLPIFEFVPRA